MKTKTLIPILALSVVVALTTPAVAKHEDKRPRENMAETAHKIEKQARKVHRLAERNAHHRSFLEVKALERLHVLENEARSFHRSIESRRIPRRVIERDYQQLLRAFYRAENSLHWMHAYDVVDREFDRLAYMVEDLEASFGGKSYGWRSRSWRRFGSLSSPVWGPRVSARSRRG